MKYFWTTIETINRNACEGFRHFDSCHIAWLAIFLAFAAICTLIYAKAEAPKRRRHMRITFSLVLIADLILRYAIVFLNHIPFVEYAPFQLCLISMILVIIHTFMYTETSLWKFTGNFLYLAGFPGGLSALLFPSWTALPAFANAMSIHSFSSHIIFATYIIMLTAAGDIKPDIKTVPASVAALVVMSAGVFLFDIRCGMNFMYLVKLSPGSPLAPFAVLGDYRIGYAVILAGLVLLMYGIPLIAGKCRRS